MRIFLNQFKKQVTIPNVRPTPYEGLHIATYGEPATISCGADLLISLDGETWQELPAGETIVTNSLMIRKPEKVSFPDSSKRLTIESTERVYMSGDLSNYYDEATGYGLSIYCSMVEDMSNVKVPALRHESTNLVRSINLKKSPIIVPIPNGSLDYSFFGCYNLREIDLRYLPEEYFLNNQTTWITNVENEIVVKVNKNISKNARYEMSWRAELKGSTLIFEDYEVDETNQA